MIVAVGVFSTMSLFVWKDRTCLEAFLAVSGGEAC
jgi:hypothetical protein